VRKSRGKQGAHDRHLDSGKKGRRSIWRRE
jgi:hypothetical protein